ncbi:hypothetical protein BC936DRAFT_138019, partial [Jimgerdemannia flammicorona]
MVVKIIDLIHCHSPDAVFSEANLAQKSTPVLAFNHSVAATIESDPILAEFQAKKTYCEMHIGSEVVFRVGDVAHDFRLRSAEPALVPGVSASPE